MADQRRKKSKSGALHRSGDVNTGNKNKSKVLGPGNILVASIIFAGVILLVTFLFGFDGTAVTIRKSQDGVTQDLESDGASPFVVVDLPGRGKGLLASRDIKQGELVLREKPLFIVPRQINTSPTRLLGELISQLSEDQKGAFWNLSYVNFPNELDPEQHREEAALAIFQTNAVAAGTDGVGIFPRMARLNHGCSSAFNVVYHWRDGEQSLYVYALKPIKKGEELLTTYTDTKRSRHQRREFLVAQYGFECQCKVCSLPDHESRASDRRLEAIRSAYEKFSGWGQGQITGRKALELAQKIWTLEDEEGYWSERGRLAADAAYVAASHSDEKATREWAGKASEWYSYEVGADSREAVEMLGVVRRPEGHSAWGSRS